MRNLLHRIGTVLFALLLVSCVTTPQTANLRIGMSRDEAIKAMGQPTSVSAQANYEYLNYTVSENTGPYGSMSRPYYVRLVDGHVEAYGFMGQFGMAPVTTGAPRPTTVSNLSQATDDGIKILSVEPAQLVVGRENPVTVKIKYALQSQSQGRISIGFNTTSKTGMVTRESRTVQSGIGELTVATTVTPADWGELTDFKVTVVLALPGPATGARALGSDSKVIPLTK